LNITYNYNSNDIKIFSLANVDPYDKRFYWKTRRLYILGLSVHDGRISFDINQKFYRNFSQLPDLSVKNTINFSLKKQILAQFLFWKEKLIQLALEN